MITVCCFCGKTHPLKSDKETINPPSKLQMSHGEEWIICPWNLSSLTCSLTCKMHRMKGPQASAPFPTVLSPEQTLNNHELAPRSSPRPPRPPSWKRYRNDNKSYPQGTAFVLEAFFWLIFWEQYVHKIQLGEKKGGSFVKMKRQFKILGEWAKETVQKVAVLSLQG